jgi:enoyl-CoA hydratase/carnithine racemase
VRLATTPVVTIAKIRGRNRGGGSEAALAFDLRFASREKAVFGQPEVGAGMFPGGGALERLPLLVGRARALEIILGSDDFDADTAAQYGWINRALPDDELDDFVETLARRIASFDKAALAEAKRLVNRRALPRAEDLIETQESFLAAFSWPSLRERGARLRRRAAEVGPDFELRFGHYLVDLGDQ